jgi:deoxyribodipyrimidine photo-lyase
MPPKTWSHDTLVHYAQRRDIPSDEQGTTRLGLHLRFGTISVRALLRAGQEASETFVNELIWRDFYQMVLYHFPDSPHKAIKPAYDRIEWEANEAHFAAWCQGQTGYPMVDAGMRQLNATGYMHNRVRMVVASFLTKHLLIDWRWGEAYFAQKLLDFDQASNVGGWQWASGSGTDAAPYFRIFNPQSQLEKFDRKLEYVKKWVPEYGTASYPQPIVDHAWARQRCLERYKSGLGSAQD